MGELERARGDDRFEPARSAHRWQVASRFERLQHRMPPALPGDGYQQLSSQLKGELATDQAQVTPLQNPVRVSLANTLLFAESGVTLETAGEAALARIAPALEGWTGQKIGIRGFTDNVPIGPELRARYTW